MSCRGHVNLRAAERTARASDCARPSPAIRGQPAQENIRSHVPGVTPKSQVFPCLRDKKNLYISNPIITIFKNIICMCYVCMFVCGYFACMYAVYMCFWYPWRQEEYIIFHWSGFTDKVVNFHMGVSN